MLSKEAIKEYIIINDKIEYILSELRCKGVKPHDNYRYYTGGFPDSDGHKSFAIFSENLYVDSYTRNIKDQYGNSDLISMVMFVKDFYFSNALKWLCDILGLDYYDDVTEDIPLSIQWTNLLFEMSENIDNSEDGDKILPINENILKTYFKGGNDLFLNDGVGLTTQREFEIGFDLDSTRITIPIRDELGTLVGVKGRLFYKDDIGEKYIYLERCSKSKILYGLYKTMKYIKEKSICIVVESEKSVLVLWEKGIRNVVAIGGHLLSKAQVEKITRLGIKEVVLCYDSDVARLENGKIDKGEYIKEAQKFIEEVRVSAMVDINGNTLGEKESPVDRFENFEKMYDERKVLQIGK